MISWKLNSDYDKQKHLFTDKVKLGNNLETYICACGHIESIIKQPEQKIEYTCDECASELFYDANLAWELSFENIDYILPKEIQSKLRGIYYIQTFKDKIESKYNIYLPRDFDFANKKVIYAKKFECSITLTSKGELYETDTEHIDQKVKHRLYDELLKFIQENNYFNIPKYENTNFDLNKVIFFLQNRHLEDFDFYYWVDHCRLPKKTTNY